MQNVTRTTAKKYGVDRRSKKRVRELNEKYDVLLDANIWWWEEKERVQKGGKKKKRESTFFSQQVDSEVF